MRLVCYELFKVWKKRLFIGLLIATLAVNLLLLWYTNRSGDDTVPLSAYGLLNKDLKMLSNEDKLSFIKRIYTDTKGLELVEEVKLMEAQQTKFGTGRAEQLEAENPGVYKSYVGLYEAGGYLHYTGSLRQESLLASEVYDEFIRLENYQNTLDEIEEKAVILSSVSIFASSNTNGFSAKNIKKTAADYESMKNITIRYGVSKGFTTATNFIFSDILIVLFIFLFSSMLVFEEKEKQLFALTRITPKGRMESICAKILTLAVNIMFIIVLLYGSNLVYLSLTAGLGDLSRSVQSIGLFMGCTWKLSVGEYLMLFFGVKWLSWFAVGLMILLVSVFSKHSSVMYMIGCTVLGGGYILYRFISATSDWNCVKYINLIGLIHTNDICGKYLNLNIFGSPVSLISTALIALAAVIGLLLAAVTVSFIKIRNMETTVSPFKRVMDKLSFLRYRPSTSVTKHEAYKLLIINKALIWILVYLLVTVYEIATASVYLPPSEYYYKAYMSDLSGAVTDEKTERLNNEQNTLENAHGKLDDIHRRLEYGEITRIQANDMEAPYEKILTAEPVFKRILERYNYLTEHPAGDFVYDTGYLRLLGITEDKDSGALLAFILIAVLCFSSAFPIEYKNHAVNLIRTAQRGRGDTVYRKIGLCSMAAVFVFVMGILPEILLVQTNYGFDNLTASITSLPQFAGLPSCISILGLLLILYCVKISACISIVLVIAVISIKCKNGTLAMLVATLILGVPVLLSIMGFDYMSYVSFLPLFKMGSLLTGSYGMFLATLYSILCVIVAIGSLKWIINTFEK